MHTHTRKTRRKKSLMRSLVLGSVAVGGIVFFIAGGLFLLWASTLTLPTIDIIETQRASNSTQIFDKTGNVLLYDMHQDMRRTAISFADMSPSVKHATIAIEDAGFYTHHGIEPLAIVRAILRNLQNNDLFGGQGGSTITQQVVKNLLLSQEKTISRKLKEWVLAIRLEQQLSKDEILELYLNEAPYGGTKYGIEEASQGFFGKSAKDLTLAESAYLAALPQAPTYYSPYGNNKTALETRKNLVLSKMHDLGYTTNEEYQAAVAEMVEFRPFTSGTIKAPHFVFYVLDQLQKMYPDVDIASANMRVITTLDWYLENEAERIVYEHALRNSETYNAHNAAMMAVDPTSGEILVMVGSRDYFDEEIDGNFNIGLAKRQPGSSFKPFAYAAALLRGYTTETVVYDVRTQFSTACTKTNLTSEDGCYAPMNYDNAFRGPITFRDALAQSINVPAVKALYLGGLKETFELAGRMGISTLSEYQRYGLTLVLGGGEVSLLEMTSAYGVFAHDGYRYPYSAIKKVEDFSGKVLFESTPKGVQVLDPNVARSITNVLADNTARTPAYGDRSYLYFEGRQVAVKTGTTNDYRDTWILGYTPTIAVGAWAGNNNNTPMEKKVAGFIVAPMWNTFMNMYFEKYPDTITFTQPEPLPKDLKPVLLGYTPGVGTSTPDQRHSILHYVDKDDPRGPTPSHPTNDPQYEYWEYGVQAWITRHGTSSTQTILTPPHKNTLSDLVQITITKPNKKEAFKLNSVVSVSYTVESKKNTTSSFLYIDDVFVSTKNTAVGDFEFMPGEIGLTQGTHTLLVIVKTDDGVLGGTSIPFTVTE